MRPISFRHLTLLLAGLFLSDALFAVGEIATDITSANPLRGNHALIQKGCIRCHSVWGVGGKLGPDLAVMGTDQSFQQMASMFWNHTPRMVQLLRQKGFEWPTLSEQEMADIIGYIYFLKLLDRPGDPTRGQVVYREQRCQSCHSTGEPETKGLLPLSRFAVFVSPVPLAQAMWNAGRAMHDVQASRGIAMPRFEGREMADLQAYIRRESGFSKARTLYLALPDLTRGSALFQSRGCLRCHTPAGQRGIGPDLSAKPLRKSISEICGILWNHSFAMQTGMAARGMNFPKLEGEDLADILSYIYFLHFSSDHGDAGRGEQVFQTKGCANCHGNEAPKGKRGPNLSAGNEKYTMLRLATAMWNHAPIMYETMESEVMKWIKLDPDDMQDLSKYLQSLGKRK